MKTVLKTFGVSSRVFEHINFNYFQVFNFARYSCCVLTISMFWRVTKGRRVDAIWVYSCFVKADFGTMFVRKPIVFIVLKL